MGLDESGGNGCVIKGWAFCIGVRRSNGARGEAKEGCGIWGEAKGHY